MIERLLSEKLREGPHICLSCRVDISIDRIRTTENNYLPYLLGEQRVKLDRLGNETLEFPLEEVRQFRWEQ